MANWVTRARSRAGLGDNAGSLGDEHHTPSGVYVAEITDQVDWDNLVNSHSGHPLQLWGWGELKAHGEWTPRRLSIKGKFGSAVAQVLVRHLPPPFRALAYVPRGPAVGRDGLGGPEARVTAMEAVVSWCKANVNPIAVEFEPEWPEGTKLPGLQVQPGRNSILYPHTIILDVTRSLDDLIMELRKSTRKNVRRSDRNELDIRRVTDVAEIPDVLKVYHQTAERAGFGLHQDDYYLSVPEIFGDRSRLIAAYDSDGIPCSFAWSILSDTTGFMIWGGQNQIGHHLRANSAVYWACISDAKEFGCRNYDLNGLLGEGITAFKKSFAKHENLLIGTLDVPLNNLLYNGWERTLPLAKQTLRTVKAVNRQTLRELDPRDPKASLQVVKDLLDAGRNSTGQ